MLCNSREARPGTCRHPTPLNLNFDVSSDKGRHTSILADPPCSFDRRRRRFYDPSMEVQSARDVREG